MASSYPGAVDALTNPTATDLMDSVTVPHATQHANANDAIEAIQTELGTDPAGASATVKARLDTLDTTVSGKASTTHASSHADGGSDEVTLATSQVTGLDTALEGKAPNVCLWLPAATGNYVSCPDSAGISVVGDIDVRVRVAMDDWTPSSTATFAAKFDASGNRSWQFYIEGGSLGRLQFRWSNDGTTLLGPRTSTVATGVTDGAVKWVRVTLDVDNGAGGHDVKFYTSDDGTTWTQLGTTVTTAGTTSVFDSTAPIEIGGRGAGNAELLAGKFHRVQLLNGIGGTTVADWRGDYPHVRSRDSYSNLWTVNGTANGWMVA